MNSPFDPKDLQNKTIKELIRAVGPMVLPQLAQLGSPMVRTMIEDTVADLYANTDLSSDVGMLVQLQSGIEMLQAKSVAELRSELEKALQLASANDASREQAARMSATIASMSENEYVAFSAAVNSIMPPAIEKIQNAVYLRDGNTIEDYARKMYRMTEAEREVYQANILNGAPIGEIAQAAHDIIRKLSVDSIVAAVEDFRARVGQDDIVDLVFKGGDVVQDLISTTLATDTLSLTDKVAGTGFAKSLKSVFTAAEESIKAAGLTPDRDMTPIFEAFEKAGAQKDRIAAFKIKKPKPGSFKL